MQHRDYGIWDQMAGQWKQFRGTVREMWGRLTDDDLEQIKGNRDQLVGRIQERYGIAKEEANSQVDEWVESMREKFR